MRAAVCTLYREGMLCFLASANQAIKSLAAGAKTLLDMRLGLT